MNWYKNFFLIGQIPENAMHGEFSPDLVILSYLIAAFASFVALDMSAHLKQQNSTLFQICWLTGGAIVMGAGIWSMHFVGMLAFHMDMDMPMSYDLRWTGLSMLVATITAGIAFLFFTLKKPRPIHYLLSGIILGAAIPTMHYTGMAGMNNVVIHYIPSIFALSILIAIIAATAALWLAVTSDRGTYARRTRAKLISALIMGLAIVGMHYTGMAAAVFTPPATMETTGVSANPDVLAVLITTIVVSITCIALILSSTRYYVTSRLQNDKDFLEVVLNNLGASVMAFDADKKLRLYNQVSKKFFDNIESLNYFSTDWENKLPLLKPGSKMPYKNQEYPLELVFRGQQVKNMEAIIKNSNDKEFVVSIDGQLLEGQNGEKLGAVTVCQDITERKKVDQMKNEFISTVSHELRTPLTSIRGALGLITSGAMGEVPKEMSALLDIACNNSERLVRLINDILDTEKIESGKMIFHFTHADLCTLVEQAVIANKPYADKYKVTYTLKQEIPNSIVNMDVDRIRQVVDNLLSNAAKFSKASGTVTISMQKEGGNIRLNVSDTGTGIPEEFQARIFSKFYQVDSSDVREKGGTGLGLSICKSIIEAHSGTIGFKSTENVGTTFYFELPEVKAESVSLEATPDKENDRIILICEDEPDVSKLLGLILHQRGFKSVHVASIMEAKKALEKHKFCLMTLDLMLPDGNGLDLLRWMRSKQELESLPVVVISAISIEEQKVNGYALGIVDWINKPIDENRLYKDVAQALGDNHQNIKPKALHVEDDPDIAKVVATVINGICTTDVSVNVTTAKKMLSKNKYDLIILDLNLSNGESGYDMLAYLEEQGYRIPVVILSVDEPQTDINKNIAASLVKSKVSNKDLLDKIVSIIDKNKITNEVK